jgi:hypothetical protein
MVTGRTNYLNGLRPLFARFGQLPGTARNHIDFNEVSNYTLKKQVPIR